MISGNPTSTTSMSLEKRDKIRPLGVWSKYVSGACNMPINMALWQLIDATKQPKRTKSSANTDENPGIP